MLYYVGPLACTMIGGLSPDSQEFWGATIWLFLDPPEPLVGHY